MRAVVHLPPRTGKTETTQHWFPWTIHQRPDFRFGFFAHNQTFAAEKNEISLRIAQETGLRLSHATSRRWETYAGGGVFAIGVGGGVEGRGFNCIVVEDPYGTPQDAESAQVRGTIERWFTGVAMRRLDHENDSVLIPMHRKHPSDLAAFCIEQLGFEYLRIPALADELDDPLGRAIGESVWEERWSAEYYRQLRDGYIDARGRQVAPLSAYEWAAIYQGHPRPREGTLFKGVTFYDERELSSVAGYRVGTGLDVAWTSRTSSDWCAFAADVDLAGVGHLVDVTRMRISPVRFKGVVHAKLGLYPGATPRWYYGGAEGLIAEFWATKQTPDDVVVDVEAMPAVKDKWMRALPTSERWNAGLIRVPRNAPWVDGFVRRLLDFTGKDGDEDDEADAVVAADDQVRVELIGGPSSWGPSTTSRRRI